jgi:thiol-disulfide isomerase/thioredoxin
MAMGKLRDALQTADSALSSATTVQERANAQLYRGIIFSRMSRAGEGKLPEAEAAFRAGAEMNPQCADCKFNLGLILLKESKDEEGVEVLKTILPECKGSDREREILRFIANPGRARKDFAPEFSVKLKTGEEVSLDTLHGKVVLLDFWGVWCSPCRDSVPVLKELAGKLDSSKVAIISIDEGDSQEKWAEFVAKNGMTWG